MTHRITSYQILFIAFIFFIAFGNVNGQIYPYKNYNVQDGLINSNVFDVCEDRIGFVWCGTENGLSLFDGQQFTNYTLEELGINSDVISVIPYKHDQIIFGTESDGVYFFGKNYSSPVKINNSQISRIDDMLVNDSVLILLNEFRRIEFISLTNGETLAVDSLAHNDGCDIPIVITRLQSGKILVGRTTGLYELAGYDFHKINTGAFNDLPVYSVTENKNNELIVGTDNLIYKVGSSSNVIKLYGNSDGESRIRNVIADNRNNIWFNRWGTNSLNVVNAGKVTDITKLAGNINASITRLYEHSDGSIWFGTLGKGVYRFYGQLLLNYGVNSGLDNPNVRKLIRTENGLLMGTSDGIAYLNFETNQITFKKHLTNVTCYVRDIIQLKKNEFVVAITDPRLLKPFKIYSLEKENLSLRYVQGSGLFMEDELLMVSNWDNRFIKYHLPGFEFQEYVGPLLPEFNYNLRINAVKRDRYGHLWVASKHGLRIINKNDDKISLKSDINNYEILDIKVTENDTIYLTTSNGLYVALTDKMIQHCKVLSKKIVPSTTCMLQLSVDEFLFGTTEGLFYMHRGVQKLLSVHDGLLSNVIEDLLLISEKQVIYVASAEGLMKLDLNALRSMIDVRPKIDFLQIVYGDRIFIPGKEIIKTDYKNKPLKLIFKSFDYTNPGSLVYQYRTANKEWSSISSQELQFASIDPGDHFIEIKAGNAGGQWGDSIDVQIFLSPPFYRTWWFYIVVFVITVLLLVLFYLRQLSIYRTKQDEKTRIKQTLIELQQQALASTLNPHFVFNSLNSIQHFINSSNTHDANIYLARFSKLMRMHLDLANRSNISLEEEISRLEYYLNLEQMRFGTKLDWKIHVDPQLNIYGTEIPNMIIQPFVENSIWHGIMPSATPGNICIKIGLTKDDIIEIEIIDNGVGFSSNRENKQHESRGVNLIRERLELLDPQFEDVISFSDQNPGTRVCLRLSSRMYLVKEASESL